MSSSFRRVGAEQAKLPVMVRLLLFTAASLAAVSSRRCGPLYQRADTHALGVLRPAAHQHALAGRSGKLVGAALALRGGQSDEDAIFSMETDESGPDEKGANAEGSLDAPGGVAGERGGAAASGAAMVGGAGQEGEQVEEVEQMQEEVEQTQEEEVQEDHAGEAQRAEAAAQLQEDAQEDARVRRTPEAAPQLQEDADEEEEEEEDEVIPGPSLCPGAWNPLLPCPPKPRSLKPKPLFTTLNPKLYPTLGQAATAKATRPFRLP